MQIKTWYRRQHPKQQRNERSTLQLSIDLNTQTRLSVCVYGRQCPTVRSFNYAQKFDGGLAQLAAMFSFHWISVLLISVTFYTYLAKIVFLVPLGL